MWFSFPCLALHKESMNTLLFFIAESSIPLSLTMLHKKVCFGMGTYSITFNNRSNCIFKIQVTPLPVSGAFHTPLMAEAQPILKETLDKIDIKVPKYELYSNVTGDVYKSPEEIRR